MNIDIIKFIDQCSWQFSKTIQSLKLREKRQIIKERRIQSPYITSAYSRPPHSSRYSPKHADKEHDKYQHVVSYSGEIIIKHLYLMVSRWCSTSNFTIYRSAKSTRLMLWWFGYNED